MADPYVLQRDGLFSACADGPELLVYNGADDQPSWKQFCNNILVDVGATRDHVITVDVDGVVSFRRALDGQVFLELQVDEGQPTGMAVSPDGYVAVSTADQIVVVDRAGNRGLPFAASAFAFGPNQGSLGVGGADGSFSAVDPASGAAWGTLNVGAAVTGVAWSVLGNWVVAAANGLHIVAGDGSALLGSIPTPPLRQASCTAEGAVGAAICGQSQVLIFDLAKRTQIGTLTFRREVGGLSFGPGGILGIGLDDGDANRIDIFTGGSWRTEPHPGRGRNNWNFKSEVDFAAVRGATTYARAGGEPIAQWVAPPEDDEGSNLFMYSCCSCLMLMFMCSGCLTSAYLMRAFGFI